MKTLTLDELRGAAERVHAVLPPTPQYAWPLLCERLGAEVWVKHENHLPVGAFKCVAESPSWAPCATEA